MDSKIILAVLIVALIGIVAATYQSETNNIMSSLANVATEDSDAVESVTDLAEASAEGVNSVKVDESIVQPDSSVNSKVATTQKSSNNNNQRSSSSNSGSSSNNGGNSPSNSGASDNSGSSSNTANTPNSNTQDNSNQQTGISEADAMSIAKNSLPSGVTSDYQKVSETTINGKTYYEVNLYKDGEIIAYSEIDSTTGKITGGAIKGEAPEV